jgi:hypothetical protein
LSRSTADPAVRRRERIMVPLPVARCRWPAAVMWGHVAQNAHWRKQGGLRDCIVGGWHAGCVTGRATAAARQAVGREIGVW